MSLVSLTQIQGNSIEAIKNSITESLELINYSFSKKATNIVIKPNMCYYWDYSTGHTTDPKFVAALIQLIRERLPNSNISIIESDASAMKCKYAFRFLGFEKLAREYGVNLVNLSEDKSQPLDVKVGDQLFHLKVPETVQNADLRINVPKIKYTVAKIELTCALKNIFGCNPYPQKFRLHSKLGEAIVALNKAMKFDLCLIDDNIAAGAKTRRLGLVMASEDPVAIDSAGAKIAGLNPYRIKYFQLAEKEGLGSRKFFVKGMPISYFEERYPRKDVKKKVMGKAFTMMTRLGLNKKLGL